MSRKTDPYYRWKHSHQVKRPYVSRTLAWLRIVRIYWKEKRLDLTLHVYSCTYGRHPGVMDSPLHYHVGHSNQNILWGKYPPDKRLARRVRILTVYPYRRMRSRYRKWRKGKK